MSVSTDDQHQMVWETKPRKWRALRSTWATAMEVSGQRVEQPADSRSKRRERRRGSICDATSLSSGLRGALSEVR